MPLLEILVKAKPNGLYVFFTSKTSRFFLHLPIPNDWAFQVALVVKNLPANAVDTRCGFDPSVLEDPKEESMSTHSSILAWRMLWTKEPGGLQSLGSQRVRHN